MITTTPSTPLELAKRALHVLPRSVGQVVCNTGSVWITQDGETQDTVLAPGQNFAPDTRKRTIVYALAPSTLTLHEAGGQRAPVLPARRRNPVARVLAMG